MEPLRRLGRRENLGLGLRIEGLGPKGGHAVLQVGCR